MPVLLIVDDEPAIQHAFQRAFRGGDLVLNSLYYSLVGLKGTDKAFQTGTGLGMAAGVGAVVLPGRMGLGDEMTARTSQTEIMTVAWYLAGGLAAAAAYQAFSGDAENDTESYSDDWQVDMN